MSEALTRALVLDIEGTTSSLSFVKDELFPYARARLPAYVTEHVQTLGALLDDVRRIEGNAALDTQQLIATLQRWIGEDRKLTPLKSLQGLIWQEGYERGELHGHVYEDAAEALRAWHAAGLKLYIYSSGSVLAQRLIFSHTEYGDLTPYFSGYFDTAIGGKLEPESYRLIAARIGLPPAAVLFLSDHSGEISAAAIAGMQVIQVCRDPAADATRDRTRIASFAELKSPGAFPQKLRGAPAGYRTLTVETIADYLLAHSTLACRLGKDSGAWHTREVGDGNLNLVFIVEGPEGSLVVKQALPYVRLVGSSWPLPLSRSHFEHLALAEQARWAPAFVPDVYHADSAMALIVMEYLSPHVVLRKGFVRAEPYPLVGRHLGTFLARTLFHTSDLYLTAAVKKERIGAFLGNSALCKISEDLIFDEPYFSAPLNRHTRPQLDALAESMRCDTPLKLAVQELKARFLSDAEALLHGDLHTGSVLVTGTDTRVIDPEFAFYGPMGFDLGAIIGNFLLAHASQPGHERTRGERDDYRTYLLAQVRDLWTTFAQLFADLWREHAQGDLYSQRLLRDAPELRERAVSLRLQSLWDQSMGFAACKMIRRIFGLAHVEDFESIGDPELRGLRTQRGRACPRYAAQSRQLWERGDTHPGRDGARLNPRDPIERSIVIAQNGWSVSVLDQRQLPWRVERVELTSAVMAARAIREMWVRGAPLIGATAAYGLCLALREDPSDASLEHNLALLLATRPTAVNLRWALERVRASAQPHAGAARIAAAYRSAAAICDEDVRSNRAIGQYGLDLIRSAVEPGRAVNVLTHCNAGALATVDLGTALAPIYRAHELGIPVHVWVDETRPRNQGALLTAYELNRAGVEHTVITDNAGGLLMQRGAVDLCLVGADRVTRNGDVCNKIGTYLKALAARDNEVPFYVAFPFSTFDGSLASGRDITIEERDPNEVTSIGGQTPTGELAAVMLTRSRAVNPAFDITPARLVTAYITDRGVIREIAAQRRSLDQSSVDEEEGAVRADP